MTGTRWVREDALRELLACFPMDNLEGDGCALREQIEALLSEAEPEPRVALEAIVREALELYPQTYKCHPLGYEMAHIEPSDWREWREKAEKALAALPKEEAFSVRRATRSDDDGCWEAIWNGAVIGLAGTKEGAEEIIDRLRKRREASNLASDPPNGN